MINAFSKPTAKSAQGQSVEISSSTSLTSSTGFLNVTFVNDAFSVIAFDLLKECEIIHIQVCVHLLYKKLKHRYEDISLAPPSISVPRVPHHSFSFPPAKSQQLNFSPPTLDLTVPSPPWATPSLISMTILLELIFHDSAQAVLALSGKT